MELFKFILQSKRICEENVGQRVMLINHNLDVDVLHFKFICKKDDKCGFTR
jgi:hypothetical protein